MSTTMLFIIYIIDRCVEWLKRNMNEI